MRDNINRNIDYIRISVTDRCDFRCTYCMPEDGIETLKEEEILTYEEILLVAEILSEIGIEKVKITGGEPFVRLGIINLIKELKAINGIEEVTITSNGNLIGKYVDELVSIGIDGINISLDTKNKERFYEITKRDCLNEVLSSIEAIAKTDIPLKINCVPLRSTPTSELIEIAEYAKDRNIHIRFIEMMPIGLGIKHESYQQEELLEILKKNFGNYCNVTNKVGNGPSTYVKFDNFIGNVGFISAMSHKFCDQCNRIRMTSDGSIKQCLFHNDGISLKDLIRQNKNREEIIEELKKTIKSKKSEYNLDDKSESKVMGQIGG
ncbi:MAG: GTP 3',8-cyclase MoaA [Anaerorhabdus sp.]